MKEGLVKAAAVQEVMAAIGLGRAAPEVFTTLAKAQQYMRSFPVGTRFSVAHKVRASSALYVVGGLHTRLGVFLETSRGLGCCDPGRLGRTTKLRLWCAL